MGKRGIWEILAPAGVAALPVAVVPPGAAERGLGPDPGLGGCGLEPGRLQDPQAANSAAVIDYVNRHGGDFLHPDFGSPRPYGFPYAVAGRDQPRLPIRDTAYGFESDKRPFPIPRTAPIEGGASSDGDRHVLVVDRSRCVLCELYRAVFVSRGRDHRNADSGARWNLRSTKLRPDSWTSADAAGLPFYPGLVRYDEARRGRLDHAIRVTFESTRDARSTWFFGGTSDRRWNDENLNQLKRIPGRAFEVVRSAARPHVC